MDIIDVRVAKTSGIGDMIVVVPIEGDPNEEELKENPQEGMGVSLGKDVTCWI